MEPELDVDDVQGHVFPGFGTAHTVVALLRLVDADAGRRALAGLVPLITSMGDALGEKDQRRAAFAAGLAAPASTAPSLAMAMSASALRAWGHDTTAFESSFHRGMRDDAFALGDPTDTGGTPVDWTFGHTEERRVDVVLVGGHNDVDALERALDGWLRAVAPHLEAVHVERGRRRAGDKEFFGFRDGTSQPAVRGVGSDGTPVSRRAIAPQDPRSQRFARPGQRLVWPGAYLFGYPRETSVSEAPGPEAAPPTPWMRNGSYLVLRRLLQDVGAFQSAVSRLESHLRERGEDVPEGWVAAKLVGRWPDGTPLVASPGGPDPAASEDVDRVNNFAFSAGSPPTPLVSGSTLPAVPADPRGLACPKAAHVRQVNPRDGTSEIGQENHPQKLMLRRGVAFGPEPEDAPEADRGLLFLSYQTSIEGQFRFVQERWANATSQPSGDGRDPIIGQDGTDDPERHLVLFGPSRRSHRCPFHGRWVIPTGGAYLVAPGLRGLAALLGDAPPP